MTDREPRTEAGRRLARRLLGSPRGYVDFDQRGSWEQDILDIEAEAAAPSDADLRAALRTALIDYLGLADESHVPDESADRIIALLDDIQRRDRPRRSLSRSRP